MEDLAAVRTVTRALARRGLKAVLGGSGLLLSLGLVSEVRDWDLMTEASLAEVTAALEGLRWRPVSAGDPPFATEYRLEITAGDRPVDLFGRFAIRTTGGVCRLPALAAHNWEGVAVCAPEVWVAAYTLMGRTEKADLLRGWVRQHGADPAALDRLLQEPWPDEVRAEMRALRDRKAPGR